MSFYNFVLTAHGQDVYVCDECKLKGEDNFEQWEHFLNGYWTTDPPDQDGLYAVILKNNTCSFQYARQSGANHSKFIWVDKSLRNKILKRWTESYPFPSIEKGES